MPLTSFQKEVVKILAANRSPASHVAGGAVINRSDSGIRFSNDLDIFHDQAESIAASAEADVAMLRATGFDVEWDLTNPPLKRARVTRQDGALRLDWTTDSAFRFFPAQPDPEFGYCLHPADLATNKVLALAGRTKIRDFLDTILIHRTYLSLGAVLWAACGKDQGYTPPFLLDQANRHSRFQESELLLEKLAQPVDLKSLKREWIDAVARASELFQQLPAEEIGCLYLDGAGQPVTPDPMSSGFSALVRHFGSVGGTLPGSPRR